jgi:translocation and assembly module TamB
VEVGGTLAAPAPQGGFDLRRGSLTVLDRRLDFQRGRIEFSAGTLVPALDLLAESRVREVTIRVAVTGQANDPRLAFTSSPELPQDELLSRLLFDRPARELSPFQIAALAQAAAGAAGYGGPTTGGIMDRIRRTLALDRLSVGSDQRENSGSQNNGGGAVLEGGRYVAEGVYVGVRQGTTGGPPRIGVQVDILPRVRIDAETGGNSAAGDRIGLSFEREY